MNDYLRILACILFHKTAILSIDKYNLRVIIVETLDELQLYAMAWKILFYETASGKTPIKKFLDTLQIKAQQKILGYISLLQENGTRLASNYLEKVGGNIWALRPEFSGNEYRVFFFIESEEITILHIILKNTRRIPPSDIAMAEKRMNEYLERKGEKK